MHGRETETDVAIVGSALSGLIAGAILTRHGRRVVIVEHGDTVGGRGGAVPRADGYWIDFGHRDGHDVGDCQVAWHYGAEAAREAQVEIKLRRIRHPLRVHRFPDGGVVQASWGADGFLAMARDVFECPVEALPELGDLLRRFAQATADDLEAAIPQTLNRWEEANVTHPGARRALRLMATVIFHRHPGEVSVGRLMQFFQTPKAGPFIPDDDEVGGMQGLMAPWARAIAARGGEIALGWKPTEIIVDGGRACGVVAVDRANLVRDIRATVVISTYPVWENFDLIDERLFPPDFVAAARELEKHRADLIGWQAGLRRLPIVRSTGAAETHEGWNRLLRGPERAYRGGYQITSMTSRRSAPPGKHLLSMVSVRWFRGAPTAGQPWTAAKAELDEMIAYLHTFYADLDACIEWRAYQRVAAPQSTSWYWAPLRRHGLTVPTIGGLLLAGSTIEAPAAIVDIGAYAGLAAAREALSLLPLI